MGRSERRAIDVSAFPSHSSGACNLNHSLPASASGRLRRKRRPLTCALLSIAATLSVASNSANAQQAGDISEIVITATKRETIAQDTPLSISVVGEDALQTTHADSFSD